MRIICERCKKFCNGCECVPYDVECDENFKEKETIETIKKMPKADGWGKLPTIGDIKGMNEFI